MRDLDMPLDPWQADVVLAGMGRDRAGRWAADTVAEIVPRQNGKTPPLFARLLWGVEHGEKKAIWSAHQFKTARESFLLLVGLCDHDRLRHLEPKPTFGAGNEAVVFMDAGHAVQFVARSRTSGRGFGSDLIVLDEAFSLNDAQMASLIPAMSAREAPQAWWASSAPLEDSDVLRRLCIAGRGGSDGLCYLEWSASEDDDPGEPETWAKANPALGRRITERFTITERGQLSEDDFARERLGIWREDEGQTVFPPGAWAACGDPQARSRKSRARGLAIDVSPDRERASLGAAGITANGRTLIEVIKCDARTDWIMAMARDLALKADVPVVIDRGGQAASFIPLLEDAGVRIIGTGPSEMVAACGLVYDQVVEGKLVHLEQPELIAAVEGAKQRDLGDGWAWHRRRSSVDITPLVACSLAAWSVVYAKAAAEFFVA